MAFLPATSARDAFQNDVRGAADNVVPGNPVEGDGVQAAVTIMIRTMDSRGGFTGSYPSVEVGGLRSGRPAGEAGWGLTATAQSLVRLQAVRLDALDVPGDLRLSARSVPY
jgi:hypothetical protein